MLRAVEHQSGVPGRVLLISDQSPHQSSWSERFRTRRVDGLGGADGASFLTALLREQGLQEEVPVTRLV